MNGRLILDNLYQKHKLNRKSKLEIIPIKICYKYLIFNLQAYIKKQGFHICGWTIFI